MDFTTAIVTPIVSSLLVPVKRHLGFLVSSSNYVRDMLAKMTLLDDKASDIRSRQTENNAKCLVVPHHVPKWLEEVEKIKVEIAEKIPTVGVGCFKMNMRYKAGKRSYNLLKDIDRLMYEESKIEWTNDQIPLGKVSSKRPSTSVLAHHDDDGTQSRSKTSRDLIFNDALKFLESGDNKARMMALCGMGGVGKTTMMEQLKKAAADRKMFDWIVKVVVGKDPNPILIQQTIAEYIGQSLTEKVKDTRAERLQKRFEGMVEEGRKKILVILDDVWGEFNLKDIGLASPLPNGFNLLLTSREEIVCTHMGIEASSIFRIEVLNELEAKTLFWEIVGLVSDGDIEPIGEDIIKRCGGLPIAINTIACSLRDKEKYAWEDTLYRMQNKEFRVLDNIFEISYNNLKEDDQATFLLCGLFPEDYNIDIEGLLRYGWGLKLFENVHTIAKARSRVKTCVDNLIRSNMLIKSDREGFVKMHDLVRDFVLRNFSKVKQASIMNHDNYGQLKKDESYERILLTCVGMYEFHLDFNYPNLTLLMLMGGYEQLKFSEDFYARMEKLEVVALMKMHRPLLPQYSTNLRALSLFSCSLMDDDISFLGDLINLEILSLSDCNINKLPSKIGGLKRLKLLDLTGCINLCIEDNVFQNLDKLEELYMMVSKGFPIRFTDANCIELKTVSWKLSALEVEFFKYNAQLCMCFEKLERFRISIGCLLEFTMWSWGCINIYSFKNTLALVTSIKELLECRINELFRKTNILFLEVNDMSRLEDIVMHPAQNSFCNLKALCISKCANLTYLFTIAVVKGLTKLENLEIRSCPIMKSVVNGENSVIKFDNLKFLTLKDLPELVGLCDPVNVLELPELLELDLYELQNFTSIFPENNNSNVSTNKPLLNKEVPKLEKMQIDSMNHLKKIWPCEEGVYNISVLREIEVRNCNSIVNIFPSNPMRLLGHLERLGVWVCGSVEVLFNIDLGKSEQLSSNNTLRRIEVVTLKKLRDVWRIKYSENNHFVCGFQAVDSLYIRNCESLKSIMTLSTSSFDMRALIKNMVNNDSVARNTQEQEFAQVDVSWSLFQYFKEIHIFGCDALSSVIPCYAAGKTQKLQELGVENCKSLEPPETEEIKDNNIGDCTKVDQGGDITVAIPRPMNITIYKLPNLKILKIDGCESLEYIFTFSTIESLKTLEMLTVNDCAATKVIVMEEDEEQTTTASSKAVVFPRLKSIILCRLPNIEGFFLGMNINFHWPLLDYAMINDCPKMMKFTSGLSTAPGLKYMHTKLGKHNLECGLNFHVSPNLHQTPSPSLDGISSHSAISEGRTWSFQNLIKCNLDRFYRHKKIFRSNELQQLQKLETVATSGNDYVEEVFEVAPEATNNESQTVVKFTKLREVSLWRLSNLKYIWKSNQLRILEFPNLTKLFIDECYSLEHLFTCSMVGCVMQLQQLQIRKCRNMKVIVKEAEEDSASEIKFPGLKVLKLYNLPSLEGFCLAKLDIILPLLDTLEIRLCQRITSFSEGRSIAPKLTVVHTSKGSFHVGEDINSFIITKNKERYNFIERSWF